MKRADLLLSKMGLYESRARAQSAIKLGLVIVDGRVIKKSSEKISENSIIEAKKEFPWVSRGGVKLEHALKQFNISVKNKVCLDVGASTGGFTEVLYSNGAKKIYSVDVGRDQLHHRLKNIEKIVSMENFDARNLTEKHFTEPPQIIVCDASFISVTKVLDQVLTLSASEADLVILVKPQFEVGKKGISRGGIVKSESLALTSLSEVSDWIHTKGWSISATCESPIKGTSGNTEYLLHAKFRN